MQRRLLVLASALFLVLGMAGSATAGTSYYSGTVKIIIGDLEPAFITGTGVATLNGGAGGTHVTSIAVGTATPGSGISGAAIVPVTDPEGIADNGIISVRITFTAGAGTLGPFLAGSSASTEIALTAAGNKIGVSGGLVRLCLFVPGCGLNLPLDLVGLRTVSGIATAGGVGGQLTIGGSCFVRVSAAARPGAVA